MLVSYVQMASVAQEERWYLARAEADVRPCWKRPPEERFSELLVKIAYGTPQGPLFLVCSVSWPLGLAKEAA